jgi:DNA-binding NtrC family response regulator
VRLPFNSSESSEIKRLVQPQIRFEVPTVVPPQVRNDSYRIFVLDDQPAVADSIAGILKLRGYEAHARYSSASLLDLASDLTPDLLISDVVLDPNSINGIDLAIYLQRFHPQCQVILISGNPNTFELHRRARQGGHNFLLLPKPVPPETLLQEVATMLEGSERAA